jgi:hypothetical protein
MSPVFLQPTGWFISSGITNDRLTLPYIPLNVGVNYIANDLNCAIAASFLLSEKIVIFCRKSTNISIL